MEFWFGGNNATFIKGVAAVPAGCFKAGSFKAGQDGGAVPNFHKRVTHNINEAGTKQNIASGITPGTIQCSLGWEVIPAGIILPKAWADGVGRAECGFGKACGFASLDRFSIEGGYLTITEDELLSDGLVDCPDNWASFM